jgi:CheY-like chemotaxis protein
MSYTQVTILIVEDDDIDILSINRALKDLKVTNPKRYAKDGIEALDILRGTDGYDKITGPIVVFLDLNMPRMNGFKFLDEIRSDDILNKTDVFVLTTSETDTDIIDAYELDVRGYIVKSDLQGSLEEALSTLNHHWSIMAEV